MDLHAIEDGARKILIGLGVDLQDPNFVETPKRVAKKYAEIMSGMQKETMDSVMEHFSKTFPTTYSGTITLTDIVCWSMCPHHLLPVRYTVNIGYMPHRQIIGASKPERLIKILAKRLVLQEQFTDDIITTITKLIEPKGAICIVEGAHMCMRMRGVKTQKSSMITTAVSGVFETDKSLKAEFFEILKRKGDGHA